MAAKKDVWVVHLAQNVKSKAVEIDVVPLRVGADTAWCSHCCDRKKEAISLAVSTARTLYYNTVLGTNIPLDPKVEATYQFNKNPRIEIKEKKCLPTTITINPPHEIVQPDKSKKAAEELLDKITTRYAKYIEDEEYWQDVFKQQVAEIGSEV